MMDILIKGGKVIDAAGGKVYKADVAVAGGLITEVAGDIAPEGSTEVIDAAGMYVSPGFMDAHVHVESSMLSPVEFARAALLRGTTGVFVDPHEITNVAGRRAVEMWLDVAGKLPIDMFVGIPSCVPATHLEDAGATVTAADVKELITHDRCYGLAEMMNFPGIIHDIGDSREKVEIALAAGKVVDGHCPGLTGDDLASYISNGKADGVVRISSDHEVLSIEEAIEKLRRAMFVMLREGSATGNADDILPGLLKSDADLSKVLLCCDDVSARDLTSRGHMDYSVHKAIRIYIDTLGLPVEQAAARAIAHATVNTAKYFGQHKLGEVSAGKKANLVILSSIEPLKVESVIFDGKEVVSHGRFKGDLPAYDFDELMDTMNVGREIEAADFIVPAPEGASRVKARVIGIIPNSIATENLEVELEVRDGEVYPDINSDILKIAVFERHKATGMRAVGFVKGTGLTGGAIASTVAHDSHNLIVVGTSDEIMADAASHLIREGGGMVALGGDEPVYLPLKLGGLMSTGSAEEVAAAYRRVKDEGGKLGSKLGNVFLTMAFLALPVIPELKITNRGLVDVGKFDFVDLLI